MPASALIHPSASIGFRIWLLVLIPNPSNGIPEWTNRSGFENLFPEVRSARLDDSGGDLSLERRGHIRST